MRARRSPLRSCIGCRTARPKRELVRLARTAQGRLVVDPTGKLPGRGAYLCPNRECVRLAVKRRSFDRAFRRPVAPEEAAELEVAVEQFLEEDGEKERRREGARG